MPSEEPLLRVENLRVSFDEDGPPALDDVHFTLARGETIAVIGPNGAGKTVLFRAILGLVPFQGTIALAPGVRVGYVPQRISIERDLPLTVEEFLKLRTNDEEKIRATVRDVDPFHGTKRAEAHLHDVERFLRQRVGILSGGQFQKILIAWALLNDPTLLLFDEPTAGLDTGGEETVYEILARLQRERRLAILLISHDLSVVYRYAQKTLCLNRRSICFGPPREVLAPETLEHLYGHATGFYTHDHTHHPPRHG